MAKIIAIAGPPGSGKSTYALALGAALGDTAILEFDQYERATRQGLDFMEAWLERGGDFNELEAPGFAEAVAALKADRPVTPPGGSAPLPKSEYAILELPLGRAQAATAEYIDLLIWLDVPRDFALARKLLQIAGPHGRDQEPELALQWVRGYLEGYLSTIHRILAHQQAKVSPAADVYVDATRPIEENLPGLAEEVREKLAALHA